jgi:hypothetical protein
MGPTPRIPISLLAGVLGLAACSHPQKPFVFSEGIAPQRATKLLVDALAAEGVQAATIDPTAGVIVTAWGDTGYRFREDPPFNENAIDVERTVFRRYHVFLLPDGATDRTTVRLQAEAKRCTPDVTIRNQRLLGDCQDVDQFFPALQEEMDELGQKLRQTSALYTRHPPAQSAKAVAQSGR